MTNCLQGQSPWVKHTRNIHLHATDEEYNTVEANIFYLDTYSQFLLIRLWLVIAGLLSEMTGFKVTKINTYCFWPGKSLIPSYALLIKTSPSAQYRAGGMPCWQTLTHSITREPDPVIFISLKNVQELSSGYNIMRADYDCWNIAWLCIH